MTVINSSNNSASESIVFFKLNGEDELITRIGRSSLHAIIESRFGVLPSGPSKRMRSVALPLSSRELFAIRCFLTYYCLFLLLSVLWMKLGLTILLLGCGLDH